MVAAQREFVHLDRELRETVRLLGTLLGRVMEGDRGTEFLDRIERIRALAKEARAGGDWVGLNLYLSEIPNHEVRDVARAFTQFLNLTHIAEQDRDSKRIRTEAGMDWAGVFDLANGHRVLQELESLHVELVLTAHPTEILRRTLVLKYDAIAAELRHRDQSAGLERERSETNLQRLIAETWYTDDTSLERPDPQDEAKSGFAVVENSLWDAVPQCLRELDEALAGRGLPAIPVDRALIGVASWMGGDRDGNPNVTAAVTREVLMLARWMAADLYLRDVEALQTALSMRECSGELRNRVGAVIEPYRALMREIRDQLVRTRDWAALLDARPIEGIFHTTRSLYEPLALCYRSLYDCDMENIAEGPLKDTLRRVATFGINLLGLDIRQSAERHTQVFDEVTNYLGITLRGKGYGDWSEAERQEFLLRELSSKRPLFPAGWPASEEVQEVLDTCGVIAEQDGDGVAQYIISMAKAPSDVLAVILLLKESGLEARLPVVPLFETLADLEQSAATIDALLAIDWYRKHIHGELRVMIGYSASAKDAGQLAAAWAQYRAQEELVTVAQTHGVKLSLFHGRGAAVSRGGESTQLAIRSQPPGAVAGVLRVTEQGEMIRFKLGAPAIAQETITRYLTATMEATLAPPPAPSQKLRDAMTEMADVALAAYRNVVVDEHHFVEFFRTLTPAEELGTLALGSRPSRPSGTEDISSLRAIPWVFAWTQVRLMLPAWLGTDAALKTMSADLYAEMADWPFFHMQMDTLEMVLAKTDVVLSEFYANRLTPQKYRPLEQNLRSSIEGLIDVFLALKGSSQLLADQPETRDTLMVRNTYLDPLHLLQAELLERLREGGQDEVAQALKVTMAGIASGLRDTG